ncbi:MAG: TIGR00730 family Rossman fold protein [Acidobacteria bacterium]|nr:TIGR00730 family Rossman fold protein [Acidobacteriota bacterium]
MKQETPQGSRRPVAYKHEQFLDSPDARALRILSEYLEPFAHFRREKIRDTIVFFGSARVTDNNPFLELYYKQARTLARMLTEWSNQLENPARRFVICTGGGPGIMEAANRGATEAGGKNVGLNIGLPFEQLPNPYITPELSFQFHYFFMRKFWFAYLAKAMVFFPGGYGTLDELMEVLTLVQTQKVNKKIIILLYGSQFWKEVIHFDVLLRYGTISPEDVRLFEYVDDPETAFQILRDGLNKYYLQPEIPLPETVRPAPDI